MIMRRHVVLALVTIFVSMGASHRTTNFVVHAPTQQIAQRMGQLAERYRKEKAVQWLGYEMPQWRQPCPLHVHVNMSGPSGATTFTFGKYRNGRGFVTSRHMQIQGPLDRLMASVLPHEITHTVFAHHFGCPVPRWADEGGSVLSEDDIERVRHDQLTRQILNGNQQIRLRTLVGLKEYPRGKVMHLYAQGYSLSNYLINHRSDRRTFLNFVAHGMSRQGWDDAVQRYYGHRSVDELEAVWLKHLRDTKGQNHILLARNAVAGRNQKAVAQTASRTRTIVRMTVPPADLYQPRPVIRGQTPSENISQQGRPSFPRPAIGQPRSGYLPDFSRTTPSNSAWEIGDTNQSRQQPLTYRPVPVRLGPPQYLPDSAVMRERR